MKCRNCNSTLKQKIIDLGTCPPSNSYLDIIQIQSKEKFFPLKVYVCNECWLVQTFDTNKADELFNETYSYLSSYSDTWIDHTSKFVKDITKKLSLNSKSLVIEVASNDGCLLKNFLRLKIPCIGIEPTKSTANIAKKAGIKVYNSFFNRNLSIKLYDKKLYPDLMIANNVLAHVPDINDFLSGFEYLIKDDGVITFEFPHLLKMIKEVQFDTIYHEHYSYLSLSTCKKMFMQNGLKIFDVEKISTHGGSLRVYVQKLSGKRRVSLRVNNILQEEELSGIFTNSFYKDFSLKSEHLKNSMLNFLKEAKLKGKVIIGYGAAAKANTLLNYSKVDKTLVKYVVDKNPLKQNKFLPGSHIPIVSEDRIIKLKPDYVIIFPWNLKSEIMKQLNYIKDWDGKFVLFQSKLEII